MFEFRKVTAHQRRRMLLRITVAALLALVGFSALGARLWYLQVVRYEGLAARADRNRIAVMPIPPRRGEITDRNGVVLARNYRDYTLEITPAHAGQDFETLLDNIGEPDYISEGDRRRFLKNVRANGRYKPILLRNNVNEMEPSRVAAHAWKFPGVELRARWVREYPQGESAAHVIGFVGRLSEDDLERLDERGLSGNYRGTDAIGKKGIEKTWEETLHG